MHFSSYCRDLFIWYNFVFETKPATAVIKFKLRKCEVGSYSNVNDDSEIEINSGWKQKILVIQSPFDSKPKQACMGVTLQTAVVPTPQSQVHLIRNLFGKNRPAKLVKLRYLLNNSEKKKIVLS